MKDLQSVKDLIKSKVKLGAMLQEKGSIRQFSSDEQFSCPFHGEDKRPSARYYADTDTMHCFTCHKSWDIFSFLSQKNNLSFKSTLEYLIKNFSIDISKLPDAKVKIIEKRLKQNEQHYDVKKLFLIKAHNMLCSFKNKIENEKYSKLVFVFMKLKYDTTTEKFEEEAIKFKRALEKINQEI